MKCKLIDKSTGEPKLFHKTDNGEFFTTIRQAINNSNNSYTSGFFKNNEEFVELISTPKFKTIGYEKVIQDSIAKGKVRTKSVNNSIVFEVAGIDHLSRVENKNEVVSSLRQFIPHDRLNVKGNNITILPEKTYSREKMRKEFGDSVALDKEISDVLLSSSSERLSTEFPKEELRDKLLDLLSDMGFSITSVKEYEKGYKKRHSVPASAKALIDTVNDVVAFKDGKITLEELSEESAHLIVEGWNDSEIKSLTNDIVHTSLYLKYSEEYRKVYSEMYPKSSSSDIEYLVRKEILGKYLAEQLQKRTDPSFLDKVVGLIREFIQRLTKSSRLDAFIKEVEKHLYNETLSEKLDTSNSKETFFSLGSSTHDYLISSSDKIVLDKFYKGLSNLSESASMPTVIHQERQFMMAAMDLMELYSREVRILNSLLGVKDELDASEQMRATLIIDQLDPLVLRMAKVVDSFHGIPDSQKRNFNRVFDTVVKESTGIKRKFADTNQRRAESVFNKLRKYWNPANDPTRDKKIQSRIEKVQKEHSYLFNFFAPLILSNNVFIKGIAEITGLMYTRVQQNTSKVFNKYAKILSEGVPTDWLKGSYIVSPINYEKLSKERKLLEYKARKKLTEIEKNDLTEGEEFTGYLTLDGKEVTEEEFLEIDTTLLRQTKNLDSFIKIERLIAKRERPGIFGKLSKSQKAELEVYEELTSSMGDSVFIHEALTAYWADKNKSGSIFRKYDITDPAFAYEMGVHKSYMKRKLNPFDVNKQMLESGTIIQRLNSMAKDGIYFSDTSQPGSVEWRKIDGVQYYINIQKGGERIRDVFNMYISLRIREKGDFTASEEGLDNFLAEYEDKTKDMSEEEKKNWILNNGSFNFTGQEFSSNSDSIYPIDSLGSRIRREEVKTLLSALSVLSTKRRMLLSTAASYKAFNEYDPDYLTEQEKVDLEKIEAQISETRKRVHNIFKEEDLEDSINFGKYEMEKTLNKSFYRDFEQFTGKPYEDASFEDVYEFFKEYASDNSRNTLSSFIQAKKRGTYSKYQKEFIQNLKESRGNVATNSTNELVLVMESMMPSFYIRYQPTSSVNSFSDLVNGLEAGTITPDMLIQIIKNGSIGSYGVEFVPSNSFDTLDNKRLLNERFKKEYLELSNKEEFDEEDVELKLELLEKIAQTTEVGEDLYEGGLREKIAGKERQYVSLMDLRFKGLNNVGKLLSSNVFEQYYFRKTGLQRTKAILSGDNGVKQLIDELQDTVSFRPDEFEDAYKAGVNMNSIPIYGLYKLSDVEKSTDLVESYLKGYIESELHRERKGSFSDAQTLLSSVEHSLGNESKTVKAVRSYMAENYFGKRSVEHYKVNAFGKEVDFAKIMMKLKSFVATMGVGNSFVVAMSAYFTGKLQEYIIASGGVDMYTPAYKEASLEYIKLLGGSVSDVGSLSGGSKLERILRAVGLRDITSRVSNASEGKLIKNLSAENIAYGMLKAVATPVEAKIALTVLKDFRIVNINGSRKIMNFQEFRNTNRVLNPEMTNSQIKEEFNKFSNNSIYELYDDESSAVFNFNNTELSDNQIQEGLSKIMVETQDLNMRIQAQMPKGQEVLAKSHPILGFMYTFRTWLTISMANNFLGITDVIPKEKRKDNPYIRYEREWLKGKEEIGRVPVSLEFIKNVVSNFKTKGTDSFKDAWENTDDVGRQALKEVGTAQVLMSSLIVLTYLLSQFADDDDNEDSYVAQMGAYLVLRTLNESFSANSLFGVGNANEMINLINSPVVVGTTIKKMAELTNVTKMADTVSRGNYEGYNKYIADMIKITSLKNIVSIQNAKNVKATRQSYEFFNTKDNTWTILSVLDLLKNKEEE